MAKRALRMCWRYLRELVAAPFSRYHRAKLDLMSRGIPFPQNDVEFAWLCAKVQAVKPAQIMEIGSRHGGSLLMLSHFIQPSAGIISVDLPGAEWGDQQSNMALEKVASLLRRRGFPVTCLLQDSHDSSTAQQVRQVTGEQPLDLLFIDGDHTYIGVRQDWEMYSPLVREGGMVVFHDLVTPPGDARVEVGQLFAELETDFRTETTIAKWGIGVVYK